MAFQTEPNTLHPRAWRVARTIFLDVIGKTGSAIQAAEAAGHSAKFFRRRREMDEEFNQDWVEASRTAFDTLENAARSRAVNGVRKYVISRGSLVANPDYIEGVHPTSERYLYERVYSDSLLTFLMEAQDPDKRYGRKHVAVEKLTLDDILDERDEMRPDEVGPKEPIV